MITKKFKATEDLVKAIGEKWAGTYELRQLSSTEALEVADELIDYARKNGKDIQDIPNYYQNERLVYKSVKHNGKTIPYGTMPSKLMELLMQPVFEMNSVTPEERQKIFLQPL